MNKLEEKIDETNKLKSINMLQIWQEFKVTLEHLETTLHCYGLSTLRIVTRYCNNIGIYKFLELDNILNYSMINNTDTKFISYDEYPNIPSDFRIWIGKNIEILKRDIETYKRRKGETFSIYST